MSRMNHACGLAMAGLLCLGTVQAQALRDPTQAPVTETAASAGSAAIDRSAPLASGMAVVVRQGVPYLVVGTRLYASGQKVGAARIERISETEVWLREAGALRKVPLYAGIQRQVSQPAVSASKPKPSRIAPTVAQSKP